MGEKEHRGWAGIVDAEAFVDEDATDPDARQPAFRSHPAADGLEIAPSPIRLPDPDGTQGIQAPPSREVDAEGPPATPHFSANTMLRRFEDAKTPIDAKAPWWIEFKQVILTSVIGLALVVGALIFQRRDSPSIDTTRHSPIAVDEAHNASRPPESVPSHRADAHTKQGEPVIKTATPMLSIVSSPAGALVEIDGVVHGKTPMIVPGPRATRLAVTLTLDQYKKWTRVVTPNAAGHFSVNVELEPIAKTR